MIEPWNIRETHWLIDLDDRNAFEQWAIRNRYGDSAYAFRRLLELAGVKDAEKPQQ
jgi:hypothetical protein